MKPFALSLSLALTLCACTAGPGRPGGPPLRLTANPGAVIAADLAFNSMAQTKGQWSAFQATAAPDAEMFVPQRVVAAEWLKGRADPTVPASWQPHSVWSSCDGSYAVTTGEWQQQPGANGAYATLWQRQDGGGWKWLSDMSLPGTRVSAAPEMIAAKVASCTPGAQIAPYSPPPPGTDAHAGHSRDKTLQWSVDVDARSNRTFTLWLWNGKTLDPALRLTEQ